MSKFKINISNEIINNLSCYDIADLSEEFETSEEAHEHLMVFMECLSEEKFLEVCRYFNVMKVSN